MKIVCLQLNTTVGDFAGNGDRLMVGYRKAVECGADLVVAPELALSGYPPRDLLLQRDFLPAHDQRLNGIRQQTGSTPFLLGVLRENPVRPGKPLYNGAVILQNGTETFSYAKRLLPTYDVFDEDRYFEPGTVSEPILLSGKRIGVTICEDIWNDEDFWPDRLYRCDPVQELVNQGIDLLINLSASPWQLGKETTRQSILREIALRDKVPVLQVNSVGGNDELIFDGRSLLLDREGRMVVQGHAFSEDFLEVDPDESGSTASVEGTCDEEQLFCALALGTRDYVRKCGFHRVALGLSGGIDSALTAAVAVDALGCDQVLGVLMPGPYSSPGSLADAEALANVLEIEHVTLPIAAPYHAVLTQLSGVFSGTEPDVTEENIQSRLRGLTLMALANKQNRLILTTGNKSELATGYCTLYGDMCGGLAVINDLPKMMVYRICRWINRHQEIIPWSTIEKPPSAELRPNQTDQDSLPPYEILDRIVEAYVVEGKSVKEMVGEGFSETLIRDILRKIDLNEYKRRQAAPGLKVTSRAFGVGRRMPIAQKFVHP